MLKKILSLLLVGIIVFSLSACGGRDGHRVLRYELYSMSIGNVSKEIYEYSYIELDMNSNKYKLANLSNGVTRTQTGSFNIKSGYMTVTNDNKNGLQCLAFINEILTYNEDILRMDGSIQGIGKCNMVFKKTKELSKFSNQGFN